MRIISGKYRSRKLYSGGLPNYRLKSDNKRRLHNIDYVRPTSDRARETLFDVLSNKIDFNGIRCLDLFAGTGSLGFESLSRGADFCCFVDSSRVSVQFIEKNAGTLDCAESAAIYKQSVFNFLTEHAGEKFDIIFADPPYVFKRYGELIELVLQLSFSIFVIEHDSGDDIVFDTKAFDVLQKRVGKTAFTILTTEN